MPDFRPSRQALSEFCTFLVRGTGLHPHKVRYRSTLYILLLPHFCTSNIIAQPTCRSQNVSSLMKPCHSHPPDISTSIIRKSKHLPAPTSITGHPHLHSKNRSQASSKMKDQKPIELDGRTGEGGGQLVRVACALAAVATQPIRITHVRGNREGPRGGGMLCCAESQHPFPCSPSLTNPFLPPTISHLAT